MNIERNLNTSLVVSCYLDNYIANFYPIWLGIALPFLPDKYNLHTVFFFAFFFSLSLHHNHTTPLIYHTFLSFFLFLNIVKKLLYIKIKYKHNSFFFLSYHDTFYGFVCPWQAYPTAKAPIVLVGIYNEFIVLPYISIYSYIIWYKELNPTDFHFIFSACRFYPNSSIKCDDGKVDASFKPCSYKGEIIANSSMAGMNKWCVHFVLLLFFFIDRNST